MEFTDASVADVLRLTQRDDNFVREMQDSVQIVAKLFGAPNHHGTQKLIPALTNAWYYCMTTLGSYQTLGEEYTGTLRLNDYNTVPSKIAQLIWLSLYIGGEPLYDRFIARFQNKIKHSNELRPQAQTLFLKILNVFQQHKQTFRRIHHSLFYIGGKYYNISNRVMGIKYVLTRQWMKDDTFTLNFKLLGQISLIYIVFSFIQDLCTSTSNGSVSENLSAPEMFGRGCVLCGEKRKNACATPCGHIFCWDCISDSLRYQHNCPVCREVVTPSRIILLQNYV